MALIYIAGPMTGYENFNFAAFDAKRDELHELGHRVISPADLDRAFGFDPYLGDTIESAGFDMRSAVRRDVDAICHCDWLLLLDGWEKSRGAKGEKAVAEWLGLVILYPEDPIPVAASVLNPEVCCKK